MSRIGSTSTSGVRVAAQPLSNIYTVLLVLSAVALVVAVVMACVSLQTGYGAILPIGEGGKQAEAALDSAQRRLRDDDTAMDAVDEDLEQLTIEASEPAAPAA